MTRPLRIQYPGAVYHVTCRGIERRNIFNKDSDYNKMLEMLGNSCEIYQVEVYSFVLMVNHLHLLVKTPRANLSEFMRHFNISYTNYFNKEYKRCGNLYQGRYKSIIIQEDAYLTRLIHYIHLNPVRIKGKDFDSIDSMLKYLNGYKWSSFISYAGIGEIYHFINCEFVLNTYYNNSKRSFLDDMIKCLKDEEIKTLKSEIKGQVFLGDDNFIKNAIKHKNTVIQENRREISQIRNIYKEIEPQRIIKAVEEILKKSFNDIIKERGENVWLVMEMLYKYSGMNQREIGEILKRDYSTVSISRKRLREKIKEDEEIKGLFCKIEEAITCN